jgi:hypothetical protein
MAALSRLSTDFKTPSVLASALCQAAIFSQDSAHVRQACTHSSMSPTRSQSTAQARQTLAQTPQVSPWSFEPLSMKFALVWQISAQFIMSRKWSGSTCFPPVSRQWFIAICKHVL